MDIQKIVLIRKLVFSINAILYFTHFYDIMKLIYYNTLRDRDQIIYS